MRRRISVEDFRMTHSEINCTICSLNYYPVEAYANSKLCQVMMAKEWQRLGNSKNENVQIFSVHPGLVNTELIEYLAKKRQWWRENMCKVRIKR